MNENLYLTRNIFLLIFIFLDINGIGGSLPTEIGNMESLEVIDLSKQIKFSLQYLMKYVFLIFGNSIYMIFVFIGDNLLKGPLPTELGELTNLKAIIIGECNGRHLVFKVSRMNVFLLIYLHLKLKIQTIGITG